MDNVDNEKSLDLSVGKDLIYVDAEKDVNEGHKDAQGKRESKQTS